MVTRTVYLVKVKAEGRRATKIIGCEIGEQITGYTSTCNRHLAGRNLPVVQDYYVQCGLLCDCGAFQKLKVVIVRRAEIYCTVVLGHPEYIRDGGVRGILFSTFKIQVSNFQFSNP